jgi:hypothetical protein
MDCKKFQKLQMLFWEQSESQKQVFLAHQKDCPQCRDSFRKLDIAMELCRQNLVFQEPNEFWSGYWTRISKKLSKPFARQRLADRLRSIVEPITRPILGPVPAYAVVAGLLLLTLWLIPLTQTGQPIIADSAGLRSNLVANRGELVSAEPQGSMTVYLVASR